MRRNLKGGGGGAEATDGLIEFGTGANFKIDFFVCLGDFVNLIYFLIFISTEEIEGAAGHQR